MPSFPYNKHVRPAQIVVELSDDDANALAAWADTLRKRGVLKCSRQDVIRTLLRAGIKAWLAAGEAAP
jgi:cytochrome c553